MNTIYYIPIKVDNLAFYLSSACFAPANVYEKRGRDIQSLVANKLLLTETPLLVGDADCCVEICLTSTEVQKPQLTLVSEGCYLFGGFLPMSRLMKVYFPSIELMEHMKAETGLNTAFLPNNFCDCLEFQTADCPYDLTHGVVSETKLSDDYMKFQRLLGGTALLRIVKDDPYTFSRGYLPFIATMNSHIKDIMDSSGASTDGKEFYGESEWYDRIKEAESNRENRGDIYTKAIYDYAKRDGIKVAENPITHKIEVNKLSGGALVFAYLRDYKLDDDDTGARTVVDGLICDGFEGVKDAEQIAFLYGYSHGYYRFTKKYGEVAYKFNPDSWLDMYVQETMYQRTMGNKNISSFPYIDKSFCACRPKNKLAKDEFLLLDQYVICKKKATVGSDEWFDGFFQKSVRKIDEILKTLGEYIAPKILEEATRWIRREMRDMLRPLIQDALNEKDKEMQHIIAQVERKYAMQLKEVNCDLYDEIDTNHDGILDPDELHVFIKRLTSVHNNIMLVSEQKQNAVTLGQTIDVKQSSEDKKKGRSKGKKDTQTKMDL